MQGIIVTRRGLLAASAAGTVVAGLGLTGCSSSDSGGSSGTELKFGCTNFSKESLDPSNQPNAAWACMRYGIGESLFKFDEKMVPSRTWPSPARPTTSTSRGRSRCARGSSSPPAPR